MVRDDDGRLNILVEHVKSMEECILAMHATDSRMDLKTYLVALVGQGVSLTVSRLLKKHG